MKNKSNKVSLNFKLPAFSQLIFSNTLQNFCEKNSELFVISAQAAGLSLCFLLYD